MTRVSICLAAFALLSTTLRGQVSVDGGPAWKDFSIRFVPKIDPGGVSVPDDLGGAIIDPSVTGIAQRFIYDEKNKRSFGYDIELEPSADGSTAQLRIEPLHAPERAVRNGWGMWGLPLGLPKYPVIRGLKIGDTVALDLLVNPATEQKLVDYLSIIRAGTTGEHPHNFSLDDVWLTLDTPRVTIDGKALTPRNQHSNVGGRAVWLDVGGRGRFLLSLFPNEKLGFRKSGTTESNTMTFQMEGMVFRVECASPIAPGSGPYNVYVLREANPGSLPTGQFGVGAGGPVEKLLAEPRR